MKLHRAILVVALVFLPVAVALGSPIDPGIGLGGGGTTNIFNETGAILMGSVTTNNLGNATIFVMNNTRITLPFITVSATPLTGMLSCTLLSSQTFFGTAQASGPNSCNFSGPFIPLTSDGIPNGVEYSLAFTSFQPNTNLSFSVSTVPEPGTMLLVGAGLAGLVARRRRLKGVASNA
jgi:hypothetical protein